MNSTLPSWPASYSGMMCGSSTDAATLDSRMNRCLNPSSAASAGARIFSATTRPSSPSRARYTAAMPPRPICSSIRYFPTLEPTGKPPKSPGESWLVTTRPPSHFAIQPKHGHRNASRCRDRPRNLANGFKQHFYRAGVVGVLDHQHRVLPAVERKAVGNDRRYVQPIGDEVEIVLHSVLADAVDLLDAEAVRPDDRQFLEVQRSPFETLWFLDPGDDHRAAGREH